METKKCYNSVSCILSVVIIVFMIGSVLYDLFISKPEMKRSIEEIKIEIKHIEKIISEQSTIQYFDALDSIDSEADSIL